MSDEVTQLLNNLKSDDPIASERMLPLLYKELRQLASSKMAKIPPGQTLQATALVHEAWLRLEKSNAGQWDNRGHFFSAAAEAMRRILVEQARRKSSQRHGGGIKHMDADEFEIVSEAPEDKILMIHESLEILKNEDAFKAEIVKLKFFAGLKTQEIANVLEASEKTIRRHWNTAKARLYQIVQELS